MHNERSRKLPSIMLNFIPLAILHYFVIILLYLQQSQSLIAMGEENKLNKPKDDIPITEGMRDILEGNWEKIDEEKKRKAANKTLRSIAAILMCFLLFIIIDAIDANSDIDFILFPIIAIIFIFHFFRIIFLSADTDSSGPWFI